MIKSITNESSGTRQCDVAVMGAGPAGSATAALLAQSGHDVVLLEREPMPRHHVGESLIPAANAVLDRLGVIDTMHRSAFIKKYSVQFYGSSQRPSKPFYFDDYDPLGLGHTWQVVRSDFDQMLVNRASELGAEVWPQSRVTHVEFAENQAGLITVGSDANRSADPQQIEAKVVVDATGQTCFLSNRFKLLQRDPRLRNGTVWTWFKGAQRDSGRDEGATIIFSSIDQKSWFWYIPLANDVVSVGCTGSMKWMFQGNQSADEILQRELERCPAIQQRLAGATATHPARTTKDFSYRSSQCAGNGWVLVGDAYGFIDPVYSSGVFLALKSAEFAADAIHDGLQRNDLTASQLGSWQPAYDAGVENFRQLVYAFYDPDFSFAGFISEHPEYRSDLTNLLVGNVFKPGIGRMFETMLTN